MKRSSQKCEEVQTLLNRWVEGELSWLKQRRVERHVKKCPGCASILKSLQADTALLLQSLFPAPAGRAMLGRLPFRRSRRLLNSWMVAASLVIATGIGAIWWSLQSGEEARLHVIPLNSARYHIETGGIRLGKGRFRITGKGGHGRHISSSHVLVTELEGTLHATVLADEVRFMLETGHALACSTGSTPHPLPLQKEVQFRSPGSPSPKPSAGAPSSGIPGIARSTDAPGHRPAPAKNVLTPPHVLSGHVVDSDGRPVADARASFSHDPSTTGKDWILVKGGQAIPFHRDMKHTRTQKDGSFTFRGIVGRGILAVSRSGFASWSRYVSSGVRVQVVLVPETTIRGKVTHCRTGRPIAGAEIIYRHPETAEPMCRTHSRKDGSYLLRGIAPDQRGLFPAIIHATAAGYVGKYIPPVFEGARRSGILDIRMDPGITVTGRLVGTLGEPIVHGTVKTGKHDAVPAAADGSFSFSGLTMAEVLRFSAPGRIPVDLPMRKINTTKPLDVKLTRGVPYEGILLDEEDNPVGPAKVQAFEAEWTSLENRARVTAMADHEGRFRFPHLVPHKEYILLVGSSGLPRQHKMRFMSFPGQTRPEEVVIPDIGRIQGHVHSGDIDLHGAPWYLYHEGTSTTLVLNGRTDQTGCFSAWAPAGKYILHITSPCHMQQSRRTVVQAGQTRSLHIRLREGKILAGRVVDEDGRPIDGMHLKTRPASSPVTSGPDGRFVFRGLAPRKYDIVGKPPDLFYATPFLDLAKEVDTGTRSLELVVNLPAVFHGTVRDRDTLKPLFPVRILQAVPDRGLKNVGLSLLDGRFRFFGYRVGTTADLVFFSSGYQPSCLAIRMPDENSDSRPINVHLVRSSRLRGMVMEPDGTPARQGRVFALPDYPLEDTSFLFMESVLIQKDGRFTLPIPGPKARLIAVTRHGILDSALASGEGNLLLETRPFARVLFVVRDENGKMLSRLGSRRITSGNTDARRFWGHLFSTAGLSSRSMYGLPPLPPGEYLFTAVTLTGKSARVTMTLKPGLNRVALEIR